MAFQRRCDRIERGVQQGAGEELEQGWLAPSSSRGDKVSVHSARPPACQPAATTIPLFGNDLLLTPMTRKSTQRVIVEDSRTSRRYLIKRVHTCCQFLGSYYWLLGRQSTLLVGPLEFTAHRLKAGLARRVISLANSRALLPCDSKSISTLSFATPFLFFPYPLFSHRLYVSPLMTILVAHTHSHRSHARP